MKKAKPHTDICYIYEEKPAIGRTGDSVFVRQLAKDFPDYKFQVIKISRSHSNFVLPEGDTIRNIEGYQTVDLSIHGDKGQGKSSTSYRKASEFFMSVARCVEAGDLDRKQLNKLFDSAADLSPKVSFDGLWKNTTTWDLVKAVYGASTGDIPFVEHRDLLYEVLKPIWRLLSKWDELPVAKIYQADSGIFSSILAMVASHKNNGKYVINDDCLSLNALEREAQTIKLRDGGGWRPEYEAFQSTRNHWTRLVRNHCMLEADEILVNTISTANKIREQLGEDRPIRIIREGIEGETARRWGAYYSQEQDDSSYRVVFVVGFYTETLGRGLATAIQKAESKLGPGKFVVLSLSSTTPEEESSFKRVVADQVSSYAGITNEASMIEEIARSTVVAFPNQTEVGDRPIINSLHAGKPVVVSMIDGNSIFADTQISLETDCFATPNHLEGREFPNAIINLVKRKDNLEYHPRRLGEALFNHREIMNGYAKVYQLIKPVVV